jgi:acyl carrier protein phosphodiesterase
MNWLAHLLLSEPEAAFRIGNILPDILTRAELQKLSPIFQGGAETHRLIDAFTDCHPVVRRSIGRFVPPFRRFGGILVDVFYDHFLAVDWINYSEVPLGNFCAHVLRFN